jgi:hypothetical protein
MTLLKTTLVTTEMGDMESDLIASFSSNRERQNQMKGYV